MPAKRNTDTPLQASEDLSDAILMPAKVETLADGTPVALTPPGWAAQSLASLLPPVAPTFRKGTVTINDRDSLIDYVKRHGTAATAIYASQSDAGGGTVVAVLDDGAPKEPGRRVDNAILDLLPDPRFAAWLQINGKPIAQKDFMAFIDEHTREFHQPSGAQMRTYVNQLEVRKQITFKSVERDDSAAADVSFIYATDTQQVNEMKFPQVFTINVPLLRFCPPVQIEGRIRFSCDDGKLTFCIRLDDLYVLMQQAWQEVIAALREALPETPAFNGKAA